MSENDLTKGQREEVREMILDNNARILGPIGNIDEAVKKFPDDIKELTSIVIKLKTEGHHYDARIIGIGNSLDKKSGEIHERINGQNETFDGKVDNVFTKVADTEKEFNGRIDKMWQFFIGTVVLGLIVAVIGVVAIVNYLPKGEVPHAKAKTENITD